MREKQENERRGKGLKQYIADRRLAAVSLVLGILMGLMILLGIRYSRNELIYRTAGQFLGQLAGWVVCMTVMVWAICVGLDALGRGWPEIRDFQFGKFLPVNSYQKRTQARREKDCEDQGSSRDVESQGRESKQRAAKNLDLGTWLKWMFLSWCVYLPVFSGGLSGHLFLRCVRAAPSVLWKTAADNPPSINSHAISGTLHEDCGASVPYLSGRDGAVCAVAVVFYECGLFPVSVPDESAAGTAMALRCFVDVLDSESVSDGLFLCHDERCALWRIFLAVI